MTNSNSSQKCVPDSNGSKTTKAVILEEWFGVRNVVLKMSGWVRWFCGGITRQDAEDKRAMDGLKASTAKPATPHRLLT